MGATWAGIAAWDGVIALVLFASVVVGLWRGFIYESLALVNWVQAAILASAFGGSVVAALGLTGLSPQWQQVLGFVLVFVLALLLGAGWRLGCGAGCRAPVCARPIAPWVVCLASCVAPWCWCCWPWWFMAWPCKARRGGRPRWGRGGWTWAW